MKRTKAVLALLVVMIAGVASASVVAGKSPAGILQTTTTTTTTTTTGTTTTGTTGTTTTGTTTTGTTTTGTTTGTTTTTPPAPRKVTLCHHTGSRKNPHTTVSVSSSALRAHLRHGDTPGRCTTTSNIRTHSAPAHVRRWHRGLTLRAEVIREAKAAKGKGKGK